MKIFQVIKEGIKFDNCTFKILSLYDFPVVANAFVRSAEWNVWQSISQYRQKVFTSTEISNKAPNLMWSKVILSYGTQDTFAYLSIS